MLSVNVSNSIFLNPVTEGKIAESDLSFFVCTQKILKRQHYTFNFFLPRSMHACFPTHAVATPVIKFSMLKEQNKHGMHA